MKQSPQHVEITTRQALIIVSEGYVDCPFCPAAIMCQTVNPLVCSDVLKRCCQIVATEYIKNRESLNWHRKALQIAINSAATEKKQ